MADSNTSNLGLFLPDLNDVVNFATQVEANFSTIDALMGAVQCTSTARPSNTYAGQIIYEIDSGRYAQNVGSKASPSWTYMSHAARNATSGSLPTSGLSQGMLSYLTDVGAVAYYSGTAWHSATIVVGTSASRMTGSALQIGSALYETDTRRLMIWDGTSWTNKSGSYVCTSTTRPATSGAGLTIYETDTGRTLVYSGSAWVPTGQMLMATPMSTSAAGTAGSTTTGTEVFDAVLGYYTCSLVSGRRYQATVNGLIGNGNTAGDVYMVQIRDSQSGSNPTSSSALIAQSEWESPLSGSSGRQSIGLSQSFLCTVTGTHTLGFSYIKGAGVGPFTALGTREIFVEDMGAAY
jgi:hypothetical protein